MCPLKTVVGGQLSGTRSALEHVLLFESPIMLDHFDFVLSAIKLLPPNQGRLQPSSF